MKKIRPLLILSILIIPILSCVLACSEDFNITLKLGKNLISLPVSPASASISDVLSQIQGSYTDVWMADMADQNDPWKHYNPANPTLNDLASMETGQGYWIIATQDTILPVSGSITKNNYTFNLKQGWNIIGWPFLYSMAIEDALSDLQFGIDYNQVTRFNAESQVQEDYYNAPATDAFDTLDPGRAYYIYCLTAKTITISVLPQIKITSPKDGEYVNDPTVTVRGTVDDSDSTVLVNGITANMTSGIFTASIGPLSEGPNIITAEATNTAGNASTDAITIYLDTVAPVINITSPTDGATINTAPITVTGTIDDPDAYVDVNGVFADVAGGIFTADGVDLKLGANTITATATDVAGNVGTDEITVTSTVTSDYKLIKLTEDIYLGDPQIPIAGSQIVLQAKLIVEDNPASNEPIQFTIIAGNGSLLQSQVNTDVNAIATNTLTVDTDSTKINQVEAYATNYPAEKITFTIAASSDVPSQLIKITEESVNPLPGTTIQVIVKLVDQYSNPVSDEEIQFSLLSGGGSLSGPTADTNEFGEAKVYFTAPSGYTQTSQIEAKLTSNPSILTTFTIITSQLPQSTVDEVLAKVDANDSLIQDVMADIYVTSDAPWTAPESYLKIWIKGDKQKVEEISPNPGVYIRPVVTGSTTMNKELISYNPVTDIYVIKFRKTGQTDEYPYMIHQIDYDKGVIVKTEYHILQNNFETSHVSEYSNFIQTDGAWGYQLQVDKVYGEGNQLLYTTTNTYSNIQINTGIPDSEFQ